MKKLIVMDPARICGSDLTSGTSDEKHKYMEYDRAHVSASHFQSLITESSAALHDHWSYGSMQGTSQGTSSQGTLSEGTSFWDVPFHSIDDNFSQGYSYGTSSSSQGAHFSSTLSFETPSQGPSFEMPSQGSKMTLIQQGEVPQMDMMHVSHLFFFNSFNTNIHLDDGPSNTT
jgi:hypothetical protein